MIMQSSSQTTYLNIKSRCNFDEGTWLDFWKYRKTDGDKLQAGHTV